MIDLVVDLLWEQEVPGSNPGAPTDMAPLQLLELQGFFLRHRDLLFPHRGGPQKTFGAGKFGSSLLLHATHRRKSPVDNAALEPDYGARDSIRVGS